MQTRSHLIALTLVASSVCMVGCETEVETYVPPPTRDYIADIGSAYFEYASSRGRPPKSWDDIEPILNEWDRQPDLIRKSPRDGQDFEIIWNVAVHDPAIYKEDTPPIIAFEKTADDDGKRFVCNSMFAYEITEEELKNAHFPPDYKPNF